MKLQAIIFDLDGTLLDTLNDLTVAVNHALGAFGLGCIELSRVRRYVGDGVPKLLERAVYYCTHGADMKDGDECDRSLVSACLATFTEYYDKHNADSTKPYDGVAELLGEVKARGIKTAIVTNKYDGAARELKDRFFGCVDAIVGTREGVRPKPSPDGVNLALELIGADAAHAVFVGDGETDMRTAAACHIPAVDVTWGFRDAAVLEKFSPAVMIDEPKELLPALEKAGLAGEA